MLLRVCVRYAPRNSQQVIYTFTFVWFSVDLIIGVKFFRAGGAIFFPRTRLFQQSGAHPSPHPPCIWNSKNMKYENFMIKCYGSEFCMGLVLHPAMLGGHIFDPLGWLQGTRNW